MAFDAGFLAAIAAEIKQLALGGRVEKVYQPERDEIVIQMRSFEGEKRLLINAGSNNPRIGFSAVRRENPQNPPMFCMLLRKHLTGAMIKDIRQQGMDRILFIDFDATNEIGDRIELNVCMEIMGKHSNFILLSEGRVIDSMFLVA